MDKLVNIHSVVHTRVGKNSRLAVMTRMAEALPTLRATVETHGVRYEIYAYRDITDDEVRFAIWRFHHPPRGRRSVVAGQTYKVYTDYGMDD